ncbi:mitochondrial inner membrane protease subunit 1 [Stylonychia lemnae]|uniref:Mitochondrial inner membrane protease subunit 1 n=1 Tax=Stylonychia lemnae TaxID=5949 RepID=A0A078AMQ9_STYLE|nr:mitochondrial inner membrane protease subunit 1 [Stylonychia lemnae]|eukprot:CDW83680.1 mitochondrial inner membrane protease subunit 1 [Stylonychia lemnae]
MWKIVGVNGPSMLPNIDSNNSILFLDCFTTNFLRKPRIGDVIVAQNPLKPRGATVVKRVLYVEGEIAEFFDIRTQRNEKVIIPPNHIWVEGDNPNNSRDSRHYGPISLELVQGIVRFKLWPFNQFGQSLRVKI